MAKNTEVDFRISLRTARFEVLLSLARRVALLDEEIAELDTHLKPRCGGVAPARRLGVGCRLAALS